MLEIRVVNDEAQAFINKLAAGAAKDALNDGLKEFVREAHDEAFKQLSGPRRVRVRVRKYGELRKTSRRRDTTYGLGDSLIGPTKRGRRPLMDSLGARQGSYPVPVITGHLRRSEGYVLPNSVKSSNGQTFSAGPGEAVLFNSARYGKVIHDGTHSSQTYGPRPYMNDGAKVADMDKHIMAALERAHE